MRLSEVMQGPRLKVKWAYRHIDTLIRESAIMPDHLYEITNGPAFTHYPLAKSNCFALSYRPKEPIPKHYGGIIGDAVNNLRESLDYWIRGASECVGPRRKLHFPFSELRKDLEASKNFAPVKKAFPDAAEFVAKQIEPSRDTNLHLWAASSLCNDNKHNDFVPVISATNWGSRAVIKSGSSSIEGGNFVFNSDRPMTLLRSSQPISVEGDFEFSVEVKFPKGAIFEDQAVVPTLTNMAEVVSQTLDALERFIRPYCK